MGTATTGADWQVGSLVRVRERDWVVLPSEDEDVLRLRPLSGSEAETCGIYRGLEHVEPAIRSWTHHPAARAH